MNSRHLGAYDALGSGIGVAIGDHRLHTRSVVLERRVERGAVGPPSRPEGR